MTGIVDLDGVAAGFADPVTDAQAVFRAVLDAMSRPGRVVDLGDVPEPPEPLAAGAAAICLALVDFEATLWLDDAASASEAAVSHLRFHCGCPIAAMPDEARFAVVADATSMPVLASYDLGSDAYPDLSTTVIVQVDGLDEGRGRRLCGPGIDGHAQLDIVGMPDRF